MASQALGAYQRRTKRVEELLASAYPAGANTRRVKKALFALFKGAVSKDVVSRTWGKVKGDCQAWRHRSLAEEDIVYLLLDGMVVKTRLDKKATAISVPVALGVRDGQKVLLAVQPMAGESTAAWRQFLESLDVRGLRQPALVTIDGAPGPETAVTAVRGGSLPIQRCTLHKHRNRLAHAPKRLHDELDADYRDDPFPYCLRCAGAATAFLEQWRRKCRAVTDSLQEAGERLFSCIGVYRPCGKRYAPPPPSNNSTGNSAAASKPGPFSPVPIPCPCSSGHCWHQDRSRWARWMVGHIWHTPSSLHP